MKLKIMFVFLAIALAQITPSDAKSSRPPVTTPRSVVAQAKCGWNEPQRVGAFS